MSQCCPGVVLMGLLSFCITRGSALAAQEASASRKAVVRRETSRAGRASRHSTQDDVHSYEIQSQGALRTDVANEHSQFQQQLATDEKWLPDMAMQLLQMNIKSDESYWLDASDVNDVKEEKRSDKKRHDAVYVKGNNKLEVTTNQEIEFKGGGYMYLKDCYFSTGTATHGRIVTLKISIEFKTTVTGEHRFDNWSLLDFDRSDWFNVYVRGDNGKLAVSSTGDDGTQDSFFSDTALNDGNWHEVNLEFEKTSTGTTWRMEIDIGTAGEETKTVSGLHPHGIGRKKAKNRYGMIGDGSEAIKENGSRNKKYFVGSIRKVIMLADLDHTEVVVTDPRFEIDLNEITNDGSSIWLDGSGHSCNAQIGNNGQGVTAHSGSHYAFDGTGYMYINNANCALGDNSAPINKLLVSIEFSTPADACAGESSEMACNWALLDFDRSQWFNVYVRKNGSVQVSTAGRTGIDDSMISGPYEDDSGTTHHAVNDGNKHIIDFEFFQFGEWSNMILKVDDEVVAEQTGKYLGKYPGIGNIAGRVKKRFGIIGDGSEAQFMDGRRNNKFFKGNIYSIWMDTSTVSVNDCDLPDTTTGYNTTGCTNGNKQVAETACEVYCDTGYSGSAYAYCENDGGEFDLDGCTKDF